MHPVAEAIKRIDRVRLEKHVQHTRNSARGQEADEHDAEEEHEREDQCFDEEAPQRHCAGAGMHARIQHLNQRRHSDQKEV